MIYGQLGENGDEHRFILTHPAWRLAFEWLAACAPGRQPGIHQLDGDRIFVNVHGYETKPRAACRYESHRRYIDLQYCLAGGEVIEWNPLSALAPSDGHDSGKDVRHYRLPLAVGASVRLLPRRYAIFFAADAHMPKIADGDNARVDKAVVKIDRALFE